MLVKEQSQLEATSGSAELVEAARDPKEASVGDQMCHLGAQKKPQRETRWAPRLPKGIQKGSELEPLENTQIELSLQRELNPACPETPQMQPQNRVAHRGNRNEARGAQESTVRGQPGTKRLISSILRLPLDGWQFQNANCLAGGIEAGLEAVN